MNIVALLTQLASAAILLLFSLLAVGGNGSGGGIVFVNVLNLGVIGYTSWRMFKAFQRVDGSGAAVWAACTIPIALLVYFLLGMVLVALRSIGIHVG